LVSAAQVVRIFYVTACLIAATIAHIYRLTFFLSRLSAPGTSSSFMVHNSNAILVNCIKGVANLRIGDILVLYPFEYSRLPAH